MSLVGDIKDEEKFQDGSVEFTIEQESTRHEQDQNFQEFDLTPEMINNIADMLEGEEPAENGITIRMNTIPGTNITKVNLKVR